MNMIKSKKCKQCKECEPWNYDEINFNNKLCRLCFEKVLLHRLEQMVEDLKKLKVENQKLVDTIRYEKRKYHSDKNHKSASERSYIEEKCKARNCKRKIFNGERIYCFKHIILNLSLLSYDYDFLIRLNESDFFESMNNRFKLNVQPPEKIPSSDTNYYTAFFSYYFLYVMELFKLLFTAKITYSISKFLQRNDSFVFQKLINLEIDIETSLILPNKLREIIVKDPKKTRYKNATSIHSIKEKVSNINLFVYENMKYTADPFLEDKILVNTFESVFIIEQAKMSIRPEKKLLLNQMLFITDLLIRQLTWLPLQVCEDNIENLAGKIKAALMLFINIGMPSILIEITSCMIFLDLIKSGNKSKDYTLKVYEFYEHLRDYYSQGRNVNIHELDDIINEFAKSLNLKLDNRKSYWEFYNKLFHEKLDLRKYDSWIKAPKIGNSNPPQVKMNVRYSLRHQNKTALSGDAAPEYKRFIELLSQFGINFWEDKTRKIWTFFLDDMKILTSLKYIFPELGSKKIAIIDTNYFLQNKNPLYEMLFKDYRQEG